VTTDRKIYSNCSKGNDTLFGSVLRMHLTHFLNVRSFVTKGKKIKDLRLSLHGRTLLDQTETAALRRRGLQAELNITAGRNRLCCFVSFHLLDMSIALRTQPPSLVQDLCETVVVRNLKGER
jgi:hypothetical protein